MGLVTTILITLFTLGVLVTFHEYGHFWVARKRGIKVLRFSVGFGTPLVKWHDKHGTEFVIAALPLGGYVKMLDEREGAVAPEDLSSAFTQKSVWSRIAVVSAGPIANLLLAVLVLWVVNLGGQRGIVPIIDGVEHGSLAEKAGLEAGQEIIEIDGKPTPTWQALNMSLLSRLGETGILAIASKYPDSDLVYQSELELVDWLKGTEQPDLTGGLGVKLFRPHVQLTLSDVSKASPAEAAGLKAGDEITSADGVDMQNWSQWVAYVVARGDQDIALSYKRDGQLYETRIRPAVVETEDGKKIGRVGVRPVGGTWPEHMLRDFHYSPVQALSAAAKRTWDLSLFTLSSIKKMLFGQISAKNLSGPITIAQVASDSAEAGWRSYLGFLALLSVSLGVLNLLPIPVLDGGHLLFYMLEILKGSPVSDKMQLVGQQIGMFVIMGVMVLAFVNDFARL